MVGLVRPYDLSIWGVLERNMGSNIDAVDREALEWLVRMLDQAVTADERRAFLEWLNRDTAHPAALARAEELWHRFDIVQPELHRLRSERKGVNRRVALMGGLAVLSGSVVSLTIARSHLFADYRTDIGQRRRVIFPDGTSAELGSYSALSATLTTRERVVTLHRGQAVFDVAKDREGVPFTVKAAQGTATIRSGQFDLKHVGDEVVVTAINAPLSVESGGHAAIEVTHGWQVTYGDRGVIGPAQVDLDVTDAWRRGRIVFQDAPLRRVLVELERYRRGRIVLLDRAIGEMPVTAVFDIAQADHALQTIVDTLPLRALGSSNLVTFVYPA